MIYKKLLTCLMGCLLCACSSDRPASSDTPAEAATPAMEIKHVDALQAAQLLADTPDTLILDIRTPDEFSAGHLDGAKNVDYHGPDFESNLSHLDRESVILVHCASGRRSGNSLKFFKRLGFAHVHHLDGGYKAWVKAGLETVK